MKKPIIYWYRQDLRIHDLPGLIGAAATGQPVIVCYILDESSANEWTMGGASRWWLHHSLKSLEQQLFALGATLTLRRGPALQTLQQLASETDASAIYCSRMYEPWAEDLEQSLHRQLSEQDITFKRFGGTLLNEPGTVKNLSGLPYKVFTPFWRSCIAKGEPPLPQQLSESIQWYNTTIASDKLDAWALRPQQPDWAEHWSNWWSPGSEGAQEKINDFLKTGIHNYSDGRDFPSLEATTRLSPHLHFGEVSPREVWHQIRGAGARNPSLDGQVEKFFSELGWREFSYHLMHHFPHLTEQAFKTQFRDFPWIADDKRLTAWQTGQTGYPMVDAGMRELWQTGYMHNRVRMITASFLTKHLLIHWRQGAQWFWDTLLDADLANNSSGWQWVAGSGADASPYFRIFNPITQGKKFDGDGHYIRKWVPELAALPDRYLNCPWDAPQSILDAAKVSLGKDYPLPIVDHKMARESALAAYASIKT